MKIGTVELPIVSNIDEQEQSDVTEIKSELDSIAVKHTPEVETLIISGFLNQEAHSTSKTINQQKSDLKSLRKKEKLENDINYKEYKGYLLIENISIDENTDSKIIKEIEIEARYFPWPKYYSGPFPAVAEYGYEYGYNYGGQA